MTGIVEIPKQEYLIPEEKIISPLVTVLGEVAPQVHGSTKSSPKALNKSLDELFPEQQYDEKRIQKAREILGEVTDRYTAEQLRDIVTEIQYLVDTWLDDFERQVFAGKTLKELLHERGGL